MSDDLQKLKERAEEEVARDAGDAASRARKAAAEASSKLSAEEKKRRDDARAPSGFLWSMRMFYVGFAGMLLLVWLGVALLETDLRGSLPMLGWAACAWAAVTAFFVVDSLTWRGRLPFALEGFDQIDGRDDTGSDRIPLIDFEVRLEMKEGAEHAKTALSLLCSAANREMSSDKELREARLRGWAVHGHGLAASGEGTKAIFTTRVVEKWLRRDLKVVARNFPISRVVVTAKYSGRSYWSPASSD